MFWETHLGTLGRAPDSWTTGGTAPDATAMMPTIAAIPSGRRRLVDLEMHRSLTWERRAMTVNWEWRPDHGSMTWEFSFDPLHYGVGGDRRRSFIAEVQDDLRHFGFVLNGEVRVGWELFVDEQDRLETSSGADVDNFAKLLNDSLKGPLGLLVDDSQIQRLEVAWQSSLDTSAFRLDIGCRPDDFTSKPLKLYQMPDDLWYPMTDLDGFQSQAALCGGLALMVAKYRRVRHLLRGHGVSRAKAYEYSAPIKPTSMGYHKTRVADSGFVLVPEAEWRLGLAKLPALLRSRLVWSRDALEAESAAIAEALLPNSPR